MSNGFGNNPRGPRPPEQVLEEIFSRVPGGGNLSPYFGLLAVVAGLVIWIATGIYQVEASEVGVVLRFGRVVDTTDPGLHWHLPYPIETVLTVPVTVVRKEEVGYRTVSVGPPARYRDVVEEARMLTADGNIVDLDFIVQYRIKDPIAYLFRVRDAVDTLRDCAESAMREVIGHVDIDFALTEGRAEIQVEAQKLLQDMLDSYESGLHVSTVKLQDVEPPEPVQDAFKDVINAEQDKERSINEAQGFANDILPKARGTAARMENESQAYAETVVKDAQGEAGRFELVYAAYAQAPEITATRMYLETLDSVLPSMRKVIMDEGAKGAVLPLLNLENATTPLVAGEAK